MSTYVIADVHNDNERFEAILNQILLTSDDYHIYILGDLFDRCIVRADPVGVYYNVLKLGDKATVLAGNHDIWLSQYIEEYLATPESNREKLRPYHYNTFSIMRGSMTDVDLKNVSEFIKSFPLQVELSIAERKYLLAHAQTSNPSDKKDVLYYVTGGEDETFYVNGIQGYTSICGHTDSSFMYKYGGKYSDPKSPSIWQNDLGNLIMMDCGCGYESGRLAALCLDTGEEFYSSPHK